MHTRDICLATTATDPFVPGVVAMLGSFRAHHPGFAGDVVILHDGLSEASRTVLAAIDGRVRFESIRPALLKRVARLREADPRAHGDDEPAHRPAGLLFRRWYDAYTDILAHTHLRAARPGLEKESAAPAAPGKPKGP